MGNESASSSWTVTIDTDAPVKPTIDAALDDVGSVQGNWRTAAAPTIRPRP